MFLLKSYDFRISIPSISTADDCKFYYITPQRTDLSVRYTLRDIRRAFTTFLETFKRDGRLSQRPG